MNRDNRDWNDYGYDQHHNRHQFRQNDWPGRDMSHDPQHLHQYRHNQENFHQHNQFRPQHDQHQNRPYGSSNQYRQQDRQYGSSSQYRNDQNGRHPYQGNYSHDQDRFGQQYQDNFRKDPTLPRGGEDEDLMGNIRQGYGISSYDGTSDRFNTLNSEHRYGSRQDEQAYYSGDRDGYNRSQFGGGLGESGMHSHRGIPDYGIHNFADGEGSGLGSSYGGTNYGAGRGYSGGHRGGTLGNSSYGSYSGNYGGSNPMGGSSYGGGRSSYGDTAHNSDRGTTELGGF